MGFGMGVEDSLEEFTEGSFAEVLSDRREHDPKRTRRILLCSGKIYYDLDEQRRDLKDRNVALIRLEQLYPFPAEALRTALEAYPDHTPLLWVQEEPSNMGPLGFVQHQLGPHPYDRFELQTLCRAESASPATGSSGAHKIEQQRLIERAFGTGPAAGSDEDDSQDADNEGSEESSENGEEENADDPTEEKT